jgi:hypothetical protein
MTNGKIVDSSVWVDYFNAILLIKEQILPKDL